MSIGEGITKESLNLIFLLDTSLSMSGARIGQLNHAIPEALQELKKVAIDEETFGEIFTEAMAMVEEMAQLDANMNAELRDTAIEYTIKGGYVIAMTLKYGVDMTIEGTKMTMDIDMTMEIIDPGKPVTITPPEGYKDFEDIGDLYA